MGVSLPKGVSRVEGGGSVVRLLELLAGPDGGTGRTPHSVIALTSKGLEAARLRADAWVDNAPEGRESRGRDELLNGETGEG